MQCFRFVRVWGVTKIFVSWFSERCERNDQSHLASWLANAFVHDLKYFIDDIFANKSALLFKIWNAQFHHFHIQLQRRYHNYDFWGHWYFLLFGAWEWKCFWMRQLSNVCSERSDFCIYLNKFNERTGRVTKCLGSVENPAITRTSHLKFKSLDR